MKVGNEATRLCIIRLLVELVYTLSSAEYRKFDGKFKSICPFIAHTLISSIFNLLQQFLNGEEPLLYSWI